MNKFIENIFSIKNKNSHKKQLTILGFKITWNNPVNINDICRNVIQTELNNLNYKIIKGVQRSITTALLHQKTFGDFKNKYKNKTIVMIGAGPTVKDFLPINKKDVVYIGLNRAFLYDKVNFDILFAIDQAGINHYYKEFANYQGNDCIKFLGDQNIKKPGYQIPESYILNLKNVREYKTTSGYLPHEFTFNIESEPLGNFCTVSLQAMQFILYTNPSKVYLVGIDCNAASMGHFQGKGLEDSSRISKTDSNDKTSIKDYTFLKSFVEFYYPNIEIISVNPVGLKGIFKDVYTESYLAEHPEIREELGENIEILSTKEMESV